MVRTASRTWTQVATGALPYASVWCLIAWAGFGVPGFILVCILAMFRAGTKERWSSEASAYSVFNRGERIAGTLTAEQIDGQLRNGGHAARDAPAAPTGHWWGRGHKVSSGASGPAEQQPTEAELRQRRAVAADAALARLRQQGSGTESSGAG